MKRPSIILLVALAFMLTQPLLVMAVTNGVQVDEGVTLNASSAPAVTVSASQTNANLTAHVASGSDTVTWQADNGNMSVTGHGGTNVTVTQIEGTFTDTTSINASSGWVEINPDDKPPANFSQIDSFDWRNPTVDDGQVDFRVDGSGTGYVNISSVQPNTDIAAKNQNGQSIGQATSNANGWVNFTLSLSSHQVQLQTVNATRPTLKNPDPEGPQNDFPTTLEVDVEDPDFPQGDTVTVEFNHNGASVGSATLNSEGTASTTISTPPRGLNRWNVTATDNFGNVQTLNVTYRTPNNLTFREREEPHTIIDDREVNVTFFVNETIDERSTSNGNITMDGLPIDDPLVAEIETNDTGASNPDAYRDVDSVIIDFTKQTDAYLIKNSTEINNVTWVLDDRTGGAFSDEPQVIVEREINQTSYSDPQWEAVAGDTFGAAGVTTVIENDQRHRVRVRSADGNERLLGAYTTQQDQAVSLEVGSITAGPSGPDTDWTWNATYDKNGNENVRFVLNDTAESTDRLWLTVYEFNNRSNVLVSNQSFSGPYGTFSYSRPVPKSQNDTQWVVDVVVVRSDGNYKIQKPVGPRQPVLPGLPTRVKIIISIGSILIVAGLFSQLNGHIGGLVVAGVGGLYWYINFLPPATGIGVVVLAMITAGIIFIRERSRGVSP